VVKSLGGTNVLQEFTFPTLKVEQHRGGMFPMFQASSKFKFTVDENVLSQLLVPSQLAVK
jgi:hypothetical protein